MGRPKQPPKEKTAVIIRVPPDVRDFLRSEAERYGNSVSAEAVRSIRMRMEREAAHA